jgi:hypothetical protein
VAAVARVPPTMLQFMVAPEWDVVSGVGIDVPGLEEGEYWIDRTVEGEVAVLFRVMIMPSRFET